MTRSEWDRIGALLGHGSTSHRTLGLLGADAVLAALAWHLNRQGGWAIAAAIAVQALVFVHAYLLHHEAVHKAVFVSARRNEALGHVLAFVLAFPFLPRQRSHALHHTWTGHPTRDLANERAIRRFGNIDARTTRRMEFLWRLWFPLLVVNDRIGLWRDPFARLRKQPSSRRFRREVVWMRIYMVAYVVAIAALAVSGLLLVAARYVLPALVIGLFVEELANLPHHAETPLIESARALPLWEQAKVTHSCKPVPVWSTFVLLNFNFHVAHHAFPWVPWHRLRQAHRLMAASDPSMAVLGDHEIAWYLSRRRKRFMEVMGHYFVLESKKRLQVAQEVV